MSVTPCDMSAPMVKRFHELGVKSICCRSIGYDHVDRETARELGMKVANVDYPPNGVANFAIMLMLMSLRKAGTSSSAAKRRTTPCREKSAAIFPPALWV